MLELLPILRGGGESYSLATSGAIVTFCGPPVSLSEINPLGPLDPGVQLLFTTRPTVKFNLELADTLNGGGVVNMIQFSVGEFWA
jgi:hypothetical protein